MGRNNADEKWVHSNYAKYKDEDEDEEEEALSFCDLPINEENQSRKEEAQAMETQEDFVFGTSAGGSVLTESEICAADEVFFQGQMIPLRHSMSSESGLAGFGNDSRNPSRCISRSESMNHSHSAGFTTVSSRSSSIRSHYSSSSGSSTTTTTTRYQPRVRNQFHSHPSPTPQIRFSNIRHGNVGHHSKKSTIWSLFRVGLVKTPEIGLQDLKVRSNNNTSKNFGSRNSTSSTSSSVSNGKSKNDDFNIEKKKKQSLFNRKDAVLFVGCKCSVDAVETVGSSRMVRVKNRSTINVNEAPGKEEKEEAAKKTKQNQGKQAMSRHRTFEWLRQLSLEVAPHEA